MKKKKKRAELKDQEIRETERQIRIIFAFPAIVSIVLMLLAARNIIQRNPTLLPASGGQEVKEKTKTGRADLANFRYQIPEEWSFPDGTTKPGAFEIENPADNPYTMQVILKERGGEELYRSPALNPGEKISGLLLNKSLPKGETATNAQIVAGEPGTGRELGQMSMEVKIEVP